VPAPAAYKRARRPEHKRERHQAILAAARTLATKRAVREISLGDIAQYVGQSKSSLLRYFESREHIFLTVLLSEWQRWRVDAAARLASAEPTSAAVAAAIADTLSSRPLLCDLISEMSSVLERNVSIETVQAFKGASLDEVDALGIAVGHCLTTLSSDDSREVVAAAMIITAGLWPIANPAARVSAMFEEVPALTRAHVEFGTRLTSLTRTLIDGLLARAPQRLEPLD
jgi:AcrR family transcriptional regulator